MRYQFHILCSLALSFPLLQVFFKGYFLPLTLAGIIIGSLLPDSDVSNSKVYQSPLWLLAMVNRYVILLPASVIAYLVGIKDSFGHRKLLHSITGLGLLLIFWGFAGFTIIKTFNLSFPIFFSLGVGLTLGFLLHLVEDSVTVNGITPVYPLSIKLHGLMKTGKVGLAVWRSEYAAIVYSIVLAIGQILMNSSTYFAIALFVISLIIFRIPFEI